MTTKLSLLDELLDGLASNQVSVFDASVQVLPEINEPGTVVNISLLVPNDKHPAHVLARMLIAAYNATSSLNSTKA